MILYRLYRSLDRDWRSDAPYLPRGTFPLDPPLHHQKGDLSKREERASLELYLEPRSLCDWCQLVYLVSFYRTREGDTRARVSSKFIPSPRLLGILEPRTRDEITYSDNTDGYTFREIPAYGFCLVSLLHSTSYSKKLSVKGKRNLLSCWIAWLHEVVIKRDFIQVSYSSG